MSRLAALLRVLVLSAVLLVAGTGCGSSAPEAVVDAGTVVIDVRTPAEYADGHLAGAVNLDLQSGVFEQEIAKLSTDGDYAVYCRSGNRSAQAAGLMREAGFGSVRDLGGLSDAAAATGLEVVREG